MCSKKDLGQAVEPLGALNDLPAEELAHVGLSTMKHTVNAGQPLDFLMKDDRAQSLCETFSTSLSSARRY